ncbi:hypothetical protein MKQ70_03995 [Chitinophaga sedimenti]|uniref:hypothetical protein n=1 Tax=Chitinophaga sedimenti TaxID=2033606 RepID=UPI0020052D54|nr:hypothetical protein [Chitinophaga sedimenti]MCK7554216.1 hypothetical protein [Chitinophaga sedimenti]
MAFAFKIIVVSSMLSLATHNIGMQQSLLEEREDWTRLLCKQRKRDDQGQQVPDAFTVGKAELSNPYSLRVWITPVAHFFRYLLPAITPRFGWPTALSLIYPPDKIFIRNCSLLT